MAITDLPKTCVFLANAAPGQARSRPAAPVLPQLQRLIVAPSQQAKTMGAGACMLRS